MSYFVHNNSKIDQFYVVAYKTYYTLQFAPASIKIHLALENKNNVKTMTKLKLYNAETIKYFLSYSTNPQESNVYNQRLFLLLQLSNFINKTLTQSQVIFISKKAALKRPDCTYTITND